MSVLGSIPSLKKIRKQKRKTQQLPNVHVIKGGSLGWHQLTQADVPSSPACYVFPQRGFLTVALRCVTLLRSHLVSQSVRNWPPEELSYCKMQCRGWVRASGGREGHTGTHKREHEAGDCIGRRGGHEG